ncbi:uncharacterized protein LOC131165430 [Malania oleifera]|uniref:uncharacterized protein LOC131165430 n=1 Tax=Malania oleifera TaxID=397392 RepID=UPI0025ADDA9C|nr:uncharacterized protein LOC131165430 [Malania oleifera]
MGALCKLADGLLFLYFLVMVAVAPLFDAQACLPQTLFPDFLIDLKHWYSREYGDYLVAEKPDFFVGLVWLELLLQWPLSLANLYALLAGKSWFRTTCLIHGVSVFTAMVAILAELSGSRKASEKLLMMYYPFAGFAVLAILRGLVLPSGKSATSTIGRRPMLARKKRA